jgi:replicative DNA helicase
VAAGVTNNMLADRLPPYSLEAEEAVLGSIIIDGEMYEKVHNVISVDSFYREGNAQIFQAFENLYLASTQIDQLTTTLELENMGVEEINLSTPATYVSHLTTTTPTSVHAEHYAQQVRKTHRQRLAIQKASEIAEAAPETSEADLSEMMMAAGQEIGGSTTNARRLLSMQEVFERDQLDIVDYFNNEPGTRGMTIGIKAFDDAIGGLQNGTLNVIAGRTGMGKTWVLVLIAKLLARQGKKVALFSMEMTAKEIYQRIVASDLGMDFDSMTQEERNEWGGKIYEQMIEVAKLPIYISDTADLSMAEIHAQSSMQRNRTGVDIILHDYLQLTQKPNIKGDNQAQQLNIITRACKVLAMEFDIPYVLLSQLNRESEHRGTKADEDRFRPRLTDLRGSGSIEEDANNVILLYRHDYYVAKGELSVSHEHADSIDFMAVKRRDGVESTRKAYFNPKKSELSDIPKPTYAYK